MVAFLVSASAYDFGVLQLFIDTVGQSCSSESICIPRVLSALRRSLFVMLQAFGISTSILTMSWVLHRWKRCTQWVEPFPPKHSADWLGFSRGQDTVRTQASLRLNTEWKLQGHPSCFFLAVC